MTESPFPFGAAPEAAAPEQEAEPGSRRNVVALGALAAVLLAGGAFFLLGGGEDVDDEIAFVGKRKDAGRVVALAAQLTDVDPALRSPPRVGDSRLQFLEEIGVPLGQGQHQVVHETLLIRLSHHSIGASCEAMHLSVSETPQQHP